MFFIFFQLDLFVQFVHAAIHDHTHIATSFRLFEKLLMFSLSSTYHRCQKLDPGTLRQCHDLIHHLVNALFFDLPATFRTVWCSDSCIEQTEIIIDLGYRSNRRTWISIGRFLVDRDCRRKPLDLLYVWFFHLPQELSCIRGQ